MLQLLQAKQHKYRNIICGEVYCLTGTTYEISCCLCAVKVLLEEFPQHFCEKHFSKQSECGTNDPAREDPIKTEKLHNEDEEEEEFVNDVKPMDIVELPFTLEINTEEAKQDSNDDGNANFSESTDKDSDEDYVEKRKRKLSCQKCQRSYKSKRALWEHRRRDHNNRDLQLKTNSQDDAVEIQVNALPYPCRFCSRSYKVEKILQRHIRITHSSLPKAKTEEQPKKGCYACKLCACSYKWKKSLKKHMRANHARQSERRRKCHDCKEIFTTRQEQVDHICKHTGILDEKPIDLKDMDAIATDVAVIEKIEENVKNVKADVKCADVGWETEEMHSTDNSTDDKNFAKFSCNQCAASYKWERNLKRHMLDNHTSGSKETESKLETKESNPYACYLCSISYKWKKSLKQHLRLFHNILPEKIHKCYDCNELFHFRTEVRSHDCKAKSKENDESKPSNNGQVESQATTTTVEQQPANEDNIFSSSEDSVHDDKTSIFKKNLFPCHLCERSYKSKHARWNHLRVNHKNQRECDDCGKLFHSDRQIHSHKCEQRSVFNENSTNSEEKIEQRPQADITNEVKKMVLDQECSSDAEYRPNSDKESIKEENEANSGTEKNEFACNECDKTYKWKKTLRKHIADHHDPTRPSKRSIKEPKGEFKCPECGEIFDTERKVRGHKWNKHGIFCDICGKQFTQVGNMMSHRVRHSGIKSHKCKECDNSYFTLTELRAHMMRHTKCYPRICEICGKRCRDGGVLTAHMRRHTGERPAKCSVCGKCFFSFYDLNVHSVTHSDARPFVCDLCNATFRTKKSLRVHKKVHTTERNFVCKICGKAFALDAGLVAHMRSHEPPLSSFVKRQPNTISNTISNNQTIESENPSVQNPSGNVSVASAGVPAVAVTWFID